MRTHVHITRFIALFVAIIFFSSRTYSQSLWGANGKWEVGLGFGPMFFLGDLGGTAGIGKPFVKDLDFPLTKISKNLYGNYYASEWLGFRLAINHGRLEGDDAEAPLKGGDEEDRHYRNLSFRTSIFEGYVAAEIYPTVFFERYDGLAHKLRPYVIGGFGMVHINPMAQLNGKWYAVGPLRLEGEGTAEYPDAKVTKLWQQEIPMGFGFKYYLKENFYVGLEVLHRKLFTDRADGVSSDYYIDPAIFPNYLSAPNVAIANQLYYRGTYAGYPSRPGYQFQRGDPSENDAYFSTIFRFGWRFGAENYKELKHLRCPVFY